MSHFAVVVFAKDEHEAVRLMAPYQENNMDDCPRQYCEFHEDEDCDFDPETGKRGYWENPNAKWDYYRSRKYLNTEHGYVDECKVSELLVDGTDDEIKRAKADWNAILNGTDKERFDRGLYFKREYYIEEFQDEAGYIKEHTGFLPWAFVTQDGVWHQKGNMGWWAMNDATRESREQYYKNLRETLASLPPDTMVYALDCHI